MKKNTYEIQCIPGFLLFTRINFNPSMDDYQVWDEIAYISKSQQLCRWSLGMDK